MSIEVLRIATKDYDVSLNTNEIRSAWNRFKKRTYDEALTYCEYRCSCEAQLCVMNADTGRLEKTDDWEKQRPVVFETRVYQFTIEFRSLCGIEPRIVHQLRSVSDNFKFTPFDKQTDGMFTKGMFSGSIDFLNSPGRFRLGFEFIDKDGYRHDEFVEFDVVSPKLDTKNDLESINQLINEEYENYVFEYLTLTFSSLQIRRKEKRSDIIWLSIFRSIIAKYFSAVRYILSRPNNRQTKRDYYAHPDRIKRWSNNEAERYLEHGKDADRRYYRYSQTERTVNTPENRFVKYTLRELSNQFKRVYQELELAYGDDFDGQDMMEHYSKEFSQLRNNSFFLGVGEFEGFRQESAVMQQRVGYDKVYKYWLMLKCGLELEKGETNIGLKQIWELYEIWCFLIMKRLVMKIFEINPNDREDYLARVKENKQDMLAAFRSSKLEHSITMYGKNGERADLLYQHTYNRRSGTCHSVTTEQRPDFVLNIYKENGFVLTYLYDAKYRLVDDRDEVETADEGIDYDVVDYPVNEAINQMHRYRDAIYYGLSEDQRPKNKEVIGGYILYPGRSNSEQKLQERFFTKSIEKVNIGAFPLLPKRHKPDEGDIDDLVECEALEQHLRRILLEQDKKEQLETAVPQKGLSYQNVLEPDEKTMVLVGFFKNQYQLEWIEKNGMYNTRAGLDSGSIALSEDMISAKYLLLFNPIVGTRFYRMKPGGPIAISSSDKRLKDVEGYKPSKPIYLAFRFEMKPVEGFEDYNWTNQSFISYFKINFKPHTIPLSELKKLLSKN
jgi:hypothetical protein